MNNKCLCGHKDIHHNVYHTSISSDNLLGLGFGACKHMNCKCLKYYYEGYDKELDEYLIYGHSLVCDPNREAICLICHKKGIHPHTITNSKYSGV